MTAFTASAPLIHKPLSEILSDICQGDPFHHTLAIDRKHTEVRMDSVCQTPIANDRKGRHRLTECPPFQPAKTDRSADQSNQLRNHRHRQLARRIRDHLISELMLSEVLPGQTEL